MSPQVPLPVRASVRDLLADLLGRDVKVEQATPLVLDPERPAFAASYVLDDDTPAAVVVCELALAIGAGAAIGMMPPQSVSQELERGELTGDVEEFFREVVNILAKLLNSPTTMHVRLAEVSPVPGLLPGAVAAIVLTPSQRLDYHVAIDGYGAGTMTLLAP